MVYSSCLREKKSKKKYLITNWICGVINQIKYSEKENLTFTLHKESRSKAYGATITINGNDLTSQDIEADKEVTLQIKGSDFKEGENKITIKITNTRIIDYRAPNTIRTILIT